MMCMRVDLPDPLGPMTAVNSPARMPMLTESSAVTVFDPTPKDLVTLSTRATSRASEAEVFMSQR